MFIPFKYEGCGRGGVKSEGEKRRKKLRWSVCRVYCTTTTTEDGTKLIRKDEEEDAGWVGARAGATGMWVDLIWTTGKSPQGYYFSLLVYYNQHFISADYEELLAIHNFEGDPTPRPPSPVPPSPPTNPVNIVRVVVHLYVYRV